MGRLLKKFSVPWDISKLSDGTQVARPALDLFLERRKGPPIEEMFLVDSGADCSMAPRRLCERLGIHWSDGQLMELVGISPREECNVRGYIHPLKVHVREVKLSLTIPCCFVEGDTPLVLGRAGFFDAFRIEFDQRQRLTVFRRP